MKLSNNYEQVRQILRRKQVERMTGLSRSTIYQWMKNGYFPTPVTLGRRNVGWELSDIQDWIQQCQTQKATGGRV